MVGLGNIFAREDPEEDARDIAMAERDLERLRYAEPRNATQREQIRVAIESTERHLARIRSAA